MIQFISEHKTFTTPAADNPPCLPLCGRSSDLDWAWSTVGLSFFSTFLTSGGTTFGGTTLTVFCCVGQINYHLSLLEKNPPGYLLRKNIAMVAFPGGSGTGKSHRDVDVLDCTRKHL